MDAFITWKILKILTYIYISVVILSDFGHSTQITFLMDYVCLALLLEHDAAYVPGKELVTVVHV